MKNLHFKIIKKSIVFITFFWIICSVNFSTAYAQVPVNDNQSNQKLQEEIELLKQQLAEAKKTSAATQKINDATGPQGANSGASGGLSSITSGGMPNLSNISGMMNGSGLSSITGIVQKLSSLANGGGGGASGAMGMMGGISQIMNIASQVKNLTSNPSQQSSSSVQNYANIMSGSGNIATMAQQLKSILYLNQSTGATSQQSESINDMRRINLQNATLTAITVAAQVKQALSNGSEGAALNSLMNSATGASNIRQDLAANTTSLLKLTEQVTAQNGILASQLHMQSAWMIANDGLNGREYSGNGQ